MNMFRLGTTRPGSMVTWGGSKERMPIQRLRHLRTTQIGSWPSSASSSGLIAMDYFAIDHPFPKCVILSGICGFFLGTS
jgi:hypothetical protein